MTAPFDKFIILAEMRTGSNFFEANLNQAAGVRSFGEMFNPAFIGGAAKNTFGAVTMAERDADPQVLLDAMAAEAQGLWGYRFFHDHDPRVLRLALEDRRCAKIILTRNLLESYVSLKIARVTDQWRLNDAKGAKTARIRFDLQEFSDHLEVRLAHQETIRRALQTSGQTPFLIDYRDVGNLEVLNGLLTWLGCEEPLQRLSRSTKVQNPGELRDKVENFDEMVEALGTLDQFSLFRTPSFEPARGPQVSRHVTAAQAPLIYLPVAGGPKTSVERWMAALDGVDIADLGRDLSQKDVRKWLRKTRNRRAFTILRHPVDRLYRVFCLRILYPGPDCFEDIRETLRSKYDVPIPEGEPDDSFDAAACRAAFKAFVVFVSGNIAGQTSIRIDTDWASQTGLLQGMAQFLLPDAIIRDDEAAQKLPELLPSNWGDTPTYQAGETAGDIALAEIYDDEIEQAVQTVYRRDYVMFGFGKWKAGSQAARTA
ncbi:nodulation protein NodH [Palleronia caenipelagi]|uniref:Nodulation protein NodH n=1 Tax=Palleronia caenipelagi TaxID=2489174 RepID=A0A547Q8D5_9RHOB|nr:nodulation protein NodH [Palleronia caenipelagi]TRD22634.1 nodulation protein NodH [Palleronia caenipelagi]